jgi:hypothetical protein
LVEVEFADGLRRPSLRLVLGEGAVGALGKTFGRDGVDAVETGAGVFPGDYGGEFDELAFGEVLAEGGVESVGDVGGGTGQVGGEA